MKLLNIKPLSVNKAWQGKRYKTKVYDRYIQDVKLLLPAMTVPKDEELALTVNFGFSSAASDIDNPLKPFIDCLQKKYGFDDKKIVLLIVRKTKVKKGQEFIEFDLGPLVESE